MSTSKIPLAVIPLAGRLALVLFAALALGACAPASDPDAPGSDQARVDPAEQAVATPTSTVTVDYEGTLENGTVFDSGDGVTFALDEVIPGFQTGIAGMRVGETKTLVIPPEAGYGAAGAPPDIPPNATLTFVVTLQAVR